MDNQELVTENENLKQGIKDAMLILTELPHKYIVSYSGMVHEHPDRCIRCRLEEALNV